MEPSSLMVLALLTSEMDLEHLHQKTASVLVSWMSVARILTLFLHHHLQLSSTNPSVAEETTMDLEPEFKDLLNQSPSLASGPICVLSSTQSQLSKRLDMVESQRLLTCISVEDH